MLNEVKHLLLNFSICRIDPSLLRMTKIKCKPLYARSGERGDERSDVGVSRCGQGTRTLLKIIN